MRPLCTNTAVVFFRSRPWFTFPPFAFRSFLVVRMRLSSRFEERDLARPCARIEAVPGPMSSRECLPVVASGDGYQHAVGDDWCEIFSTDFYSVWCIWRVHLVLSFSPNFEIKHRCGCPLGSKIGSLGFLDQGIDRVGVFGLSSRVAVLICMNDVHVSRSAG